MQEAGRPILVGTVSVEKSEVLSTMLKRRGIRHEVLNAKYHEKEAPIVAQAGRSGAVTIATNMAGRGTDILLGGNPSGPCLEQAARAGASTLPRRPRRSTRRPWPRRQEECAHRPRQRSWRRAGCTSSGPSATTRAASTTSCAVAPAARATPARRASTSRSRTRSSSASRTTASPGSWNAWASKATSPSSRKLVSTDRSRTPSRASRATTSTSASASSSTTTSSTSSARRSTPSATRCSATRTSVGPSRRSSMHELEQLVDAHLGEAVEEPDVDGPARAPSTASASTASELERRRRSPSWARG